MNKTTIKRNTFPIYKNVSHGYPGDEVKWSLERGAYILTRISDGKSVFTSPPVNKEGKLNSNGKTFNVLGIIAQNKSKNWIFELDHNIEETTNE